jgi:eukaryotic-like serine/threonine-protein kinase
MSAAATHGERASLRGDLDAIVAKALAKPPGERYGTIAALTADLRAWREGRPVSASPQSVAYRARRFVRRNRGTVAAIAAIVAAIVTGAAATAWQAHVAARERDKAQNRFRQVQEFSRSLLFDVHDALRPVPGATEPRRLLLSRAVRLLDGLAADAGDDDALKFELAEGYRRLGAVQGDGATENLGDTAAAVVSFEKAARLIEDVMRADPHALDRPELALNIYAQLTNALSARDRADAAEQAHQRLVALVEELDRRRGADPRTSIKVGNGYSNAGIHRAGRGDLAGARAFYERAIRVYESVAKDDPAWRETPRAYTLTLKRLGAVEMVTGGLDASERHYREALAIEEDLIRRHPDNAQWRFEMSYTLSDLGAALRRRGQTAEAVAMWERALALRRTAVAADPKNVRAIQALANILNRLYWPSRDGKRYAEALAMVREELHWRDTLLAIQGSSSARLFDRGWARLNLSGILLDLVDADARGPGARARVSEARALFQSIRLDEMKKPGNANIDAEFLGKYERESARLARR